MAEDADAGDTEDRKPFSQKVKSCLKNNFLILSLMTAIALGMIIGVAMRQRKEPYSKREIMYAGFLGSLLIRMLKCITIPLFTTSVMASLGRLNMKTCGLICVRTITYFIITSFISCVLGVILVVLIQPGVDKDVELITMSIRDTTIEDGFLDIIRNAFPSNIVEACLYTHSTLLINPNDPSKDVHDWDFKVNQLIYSSNFFGLIIMSAAVGIAMGYLAEDVKQFTDTVETINNLFIKITFAIIAVSAPGIFSLILSQILEVSDFEKTLKQIGMYVLTNLVGLFIIAIIIIPVTYSIFLRKLPFKFVFNSLPVLSTAFATASSLATMPVTLKCAEEKNHVQTHVSRFVIPLGATVNMNGAAIYVTIGPLFLAQLANIDVNFGQYLGVCITATIASVGAAAVPQSGVISMVMVMTILGVDPKMIAVIYTMDWLLDRFCTCVNVFGDLVASSVIEKLSRKQLELII